MKTTLKKLFDVSDEVVIRSLPGGIPKVVTLFCYIDFNMPFAPYKIEVIDAVTSECYASFYMPSSDESPEIELDDIGQFRINNHIFEGYARVRVNPAIFLKKTIGAL